MLKPLILITGPDGSGKSTLANLLRDHLEKKGLKAKVVRLRGTHTFAYVLMKLLRDVLKMHGSDLHYYKVKIPKKFIIPWLYLEFISIIPLIIIYYYLVRIRYAVISERSIMDVMIWLTTGIDSNVQKIFHSKPIRFLLLLATRYHDKTFYVTADIRDLISRKPNEKPWILKMLDYYNIFAKYLGFRTINTSYCSPQRCFDILLTWLKI